MKISEAIGSFLKQLVSEDIYVFAKKKYYYGRFVKQYFTFKGLNIGYTQRFQLHWKDRNPQLLDNSKKTGFDGHYIYHPAWAARILSQTNPSSHVDLSSTLTFSTLISAFIPTKFYDIRPANIRLSNLSTGSADLLSLPFGDGSISSISCMHVVEHIGLGRYGDPINPEADLIAINELIRVLAPGGNLLFVVPIGKPKLVFNAHRVYSYGQIKNYFKELKLKEFSLLPDDGGESGMLIDADENQADSQEYGCGCFWFIKRA